LAHGYELLAGGVLVHPDANPPIADDDQDPDFFRAIIGGDNGALSGRDPAELAAWRIYVPMGRCRPSPLERGGPPIALHAG
jgi:hypothetical protein